MMVLTTVVLGDAQVHGFTSGCRHEVSNHPYVLRSARYLRPYEACRSASRDKAGVAG
jgi:hypothetical protein